MYRRSLLAGVPLLGALAGCSLFTSTTTNGVTTLTMDVARTDTFVQALVSGLSQLAMLPMVPVPYQASFAAISAMILKDVAAFDAAAGGKITLKFDSASIPKEVDSVVADAQSILTTMAAALPQTALVGTVLQIVSAVKTIVLLLEAMVPPLVPASATRAMGSVPVMPEATALTILGAH